MHFLFCRSVELSEQELRLGTGYVLPTTPGRSLGLADGQVLPPFTYAFKIHMIYHKVCFIFRSVELNGQELRLGAGYALPTTPGRTVDLADGLVLPPLTYAFLVLPEVAATACMN